MPFNGTVSVVVNAEYTATADVGTVKHTIPYSPNWSLTDGTGANQAKVAFADTRTLAASASENLDLYGSLLDAFGNTLNMVKVKALIIQADSANTNDVVVGGAASNAFVGPFGAATHTVAVKPGGCIAFVAPDANGYAVTSGTADILKVANSAAGTGVNYTITIIATA